MSGFGFSGFGSGNFGEWDWSQFTLIDSMPEVYLSQDEVSGGVLTALMQSLGPTFDFIRHKIDDMGDLRDPLLAPVESDFFRPVTILQVDNLNDGTSRVFLSQGVNGDKLDGLRVGQVLTDSDGIKFTIDTINTAGLPESFAVAPIDPATGNPTGKNVIVRNISFGSLEVIPLVSGSYITDENPITSPVDDGVNVGPYAFTVLYYPIAKNRVTVEWTEGGVAKVGYFNNIGDYSGDLSVGSSINFDTGAVSIAPANNIAVDINSVVISYTTSRIYKELVTTTPITDGVTTGPYSFIIGLPPLDAVITYVTWEESNVPKSGQFSTLGVPSGDLSLSSTVTFSTGSFSVDTLSGNPIDAETLRVTYLSLEIVPPQDAEITAQNILAFLAGDYGIQLDRHDSETLQRSYVYNAYQLWDIKGTELGYQVLGKMAGYDVRALGLYRINYGYVASLDPDHVYRFADESIADEDPGTDIGSTITPSEDGISTGPFTIQVANFPIFLNDNIILNWKESGDPRTAYLNSSNLINGTNASHVASWTVNRDAGTMAVTFNGGFAPDADSVRISYYTTSFYTDLDPKLIIFDDVAADVLPLDLHCFDAGFPSITQTVDVSAVSALFLESTSTRYAVTVDTTAYSNSYESFGTEGILTDSLSKTFAIENFKRLTATTFYFETVSLDMPALGAGSILWSVLKNSTSPSDFSIVGIGTDVVALGAQYPGYTGIRYRLTKSFASLLSIGIVGNWKIIDSGGVSSWIEKVTLKDLATFTYEIEFITDIVPVPGPANFYYNCELRPDCTFCKASAIRIEVRASV